MRRGRYAKNAVFGIPTSILLLGGGVAAIYYIMKTKKKVEETVEQTKGAVGAGVPGVDGNVQPRFSNSMYTVIMGMPRSSSAATDFPFAVISNVPDNTVYYRAEVRPVGATEGVIWSSKIYGPYMMGKGEVRKDTIKWGILPVGLSPIGASPVAGAKYLEYRIVVGYSKEAIKEAVPVNLYTKWYRYYGFI